MTQVREGLRHHRPDWLSVNLVVAAVSVAGLLSLVLVATLPRIITLPSYPFSPAPVWLLLAFVLLAAVSDVVYVPVRQADAWEELTFVEVVLIWAVLTLPPLQALLTALAGFALVELIARRKPVKSLFNLATYAVCSAGLISTYLLIAGPDTTFSARSVLALILAALVFTALNLVILSMILLAAEDVAPREYIGEQWWLSVGMAIGSVGVAVVAMSIAANDPVLVPFAALPAVAMWYAYRASASHTEARERSRSLVRLGQAVATPGLPDQVIPNAADALRQAYSAEAYAVVLGSGRHFGADPQWRPPELMHREARVLRPEEMPAGWSAGVAVRMDDQSGKGVLALGGMHHHARPTSGLPWARTWDIPETDLPGLVALTTAVGSAVRAGQTMSALTAETAKLQAVVDHATDGICVVDSNGEIILWSPAAQRITGLPQPEATRDAELFHTLVGLTPDQAGHDLEFERADGQSVSLHVTRVDMWGSAATSVITIRDMTRERRAERLKSDFIATVSHELRTPITPIKGYADLLKRRWDRMSEEKRQKILDTIEERADHMTRLVDDLLVAAKADTETSLRVESVRMDAFQVARDAAIAFPEVDGRLDIQNSEPLWVNADRTRVAQIVGNLVGNALKYTPAGTPIEISFEREDELVMIHVTDHGSGIAADEQEKVFERFYRIEDPLTMKTGGSGLGLHISRQLARAMGGDVRLHSNPGEGATFTLSLSAEGE